MHSNVRTLQVLENEDDFKAWFLKCHDKQLNCFSESEIDELLKESKPECYPCIPLLAEGGFEVSFVSPKKADVWLELLRHLPEHTFEK